jgi:formylglycine-generating enzyme required for sulfatase activity
MSRGEVGAGEPSFQVYGEWPFDASEAQRRQDETARALGVPKAASLDLGFGVTLRVVLIPAGKFVTGEPDDPEEKEKRPPREVTISQPFYLSACEVSQDQYSVVTGMNPSHFSGASHPVERVSWKEALAFCGKLAERVGRDVRLPNEAEWEYACRAGATAPFHTGRSLDREQANYGYRYWTGEGAEKYYAARPHATMPVESFPPNRWGLHNMHGNVDEWCHAFPRVEGEESLASRGGSWRFPWRDCGSAERTQRSDDRWHDLGLRVVVGLKPTAQPSVPTEDPRRRPWTVYDAWPFDAGEAARRQQATAKVLDIPVSLELDLGGGESLTARLVPAGTFPMGPREAPIQVTLTRPLYAGVCEVTRAQFAAFVKATKHRTRAEESGYTVVAEREGEAETEAKGTHWRNPGIPQTDAHPAVCLGRLDAEAFCEWLTRRTGRTVRLLTEAEWEYACRSGSAGAFCFGDGPAALPQYAWFTANTKGTQPVGQKEANAWGLHDLHGNAQEWCRDHPDSERTRAAVRNPCTTTLLGGAYRGGSWRDGAAGCAATSRRSVLIAPYDVCGFRVAVEAPITPEGRVLPVDEAARLAKEITEKANAACYSLLHAPLAGFEATFAVAEDEKPCGTLAVSWSRAPDKLAARIDGDPRGKTAAINADLLAAGVEKLVTPLPWSPSRRATKSGDLYVIRDAAPPEHAQIKETVLALTEDLGKIRISLLCHDGDRVDRDFRREPVEGKLRLTSFVNRSRNSDVVSHWAYTYTRPGGVLFLRRIVLTMMKGEQTPLVVVAELQRACFWAAERPAEPQAAPAGLDPRLTSDDATYGYTRGNPIVVGGPPQGTDDRAAVRGGIAAIGSYCARLRDTWGRPIKSWLIAKSGRGPDGHDLAAYQLSAGGREHSVLAVLYFDMFHPDAGWRAAKAPKGMYIQP